MRTSTLILAKVIIRRRLHENAKSDIMKDHLSLEIAALTNIRHELVKNTTS